MNYSERGGLRWGPSSRIGTNATWPFARLTVTPERISIHVGFLVLGVKSFTLPASDVTSVQRRRGWFPFSVGMVFEHKNAGCPPFLLFWTFKPKAFEKSLSQLGYPVLMTPAK